MGDEFSFLTDSEDEIAVEDVLSQALDHSVLEQIAAINCSSFDNLPSHLENRFRKLKSLPTTRFPPARSKSFTPHTSVDFEPIPYEDSHHSKSEIRKQKDLKSKTLSDSSSSSPTQLESESESLSPTLRSEKSGTKSRSKTNSKAEMCKQKDLKSKLKSMNMSSPESESRSPSPPRGCLWCSSKKEKSVRSKQGKENRSLSSSTLGGNFNDIEFLKSFSMKEQNKIMKHAMKEEEKINREAAKIVNWAKQVSDRIMDVSGLDHLQDELSEGVGNARGMGTV